jgi:hypothetical protein
VVVGLGVEHSGTLSGKSQAPTAGLKTKSGDPSGHSFISLNILKAYLKNAIKNVL